MTASIPSVLVAAAPTLLRQGLIATLRERWPALLLTLTADATEVAGLVARRAFALLVLDGALAGRALPELVARLRRARPAQRLVVLADARPAGAAAPLAGPDTQLLPRHVPPPALAEALAPWLDAPRPEPSAVRTPRAYAGSFSPRELEVLRLVVADQCNQEIADCLCLSTRTVESHRRTLLHKAGTRTLVGLAARAVREGWVA